MGWHDIREVGINLEHWYVVAASADVQRQPHTEPFNLSYIYPHITVALGETFKIYCLLCPLSETATRAHWVHFTSLNSLSRLHKLPLAVRQFIKDRLFNIAKTYLDKLIIQDVQMMEDEQQACLNQPKRQNIELNPTLVAVQQLMQNKRV
ncbi:MAG: hypothetical protein HC833_13190 [Leptolyngbyaceae cyanobacterium RM1_406_9]|nr:hypothetical protein [Leptolyngbyaceae cyanobacterium RM1_406_9]